MPTDRNRADDSLAQVLEAFRSDSFPERLAQTMIARTAGDRPCSSWSTGNVLLMLLAGTSDARGYKQWTAAGRQVRKGSKALHILAPRVCKRRETDASGEERTRTFVAGFLTIPVFKVEDTDGEELPIVDHRPATLPPLWNVATRLGLNVTYAANPASSARGWYAPNEKAITLLTSDVDTFFHELAHAADHRAQGTINGGQDATQEIVAESVAAVLCHMYGFSGHLQDCAEYISHYSSSHDAATAVYRLVARIGKALDVIFLTGAAAPEGT